MARARQIVMGMLLLLCMLPFVSSYEITAQEGDLVQLNLDVADPDGDVIQILYQQPFSETGQWQTTWGDDGTHTTEVVVSDGVDQTPVEITIYVENVNREPLLGEVVPLDNPTIEETNAIEFTVNVIEFDEEELNYQWFINGELVNDITTDSLSHSFLYETSYSDEGMHDIRVEISDPYSTVAHSWEVTVLQKNRGPVVELKDTYEFTETDVVSLDFEAYDPDEDELFIDISAPVGDSWETGYDDAGEYEVTVTVTDGIETVEQTTIVRIAEKNREPTLALDASIGISENEDMTLVLDARDADGDEVTIEVEGAPEGSILNENILTYTPDYELVQKGETAEFNLKITASDGTAQITREMLLTVYHTNRPPVIQPYYEGEDIVYLKEGETLRLEPTVEDLDNDDIEIFYAGWTTEPNTKTDYASAGTHEVIITASDGQLVTTRTITVIIEEVNDPPVLAAIKDVSIDEGEVLALPLKVTDNDEVTFTISGLPQGALLNDGVLEWEVDYNTVSAPEEIATSFFSKITGFFGFTSSRTGAQESYKIMVTATDTFESTDTKEFTIEVHDINSAPKIVGIAPPEDVIRINKGEVVTFYVTADDFDQNELTYTWDFGLFKKSEGSESHKRRFNSVGEKTVKVHVSDGKDTVTQEWKVIIS